jgi:glycosyltransferase involved in cell wall biosynthesis
MNAVIAPIYFHVHGKYGIPLWMGFNEVLDKKQICFRHGLPDKPTITALYPIESGTGYWRMELWIREIKKKYLNKVNINVIDFTKGVPLQDIYNSQIVYLHALADVKFFMEIQKARHPASKWVVDVCDNMLKLDPANPAYANSKTPEYELAMLTTIKNADILTCSTQVLVDEYLKIRNNRETYYVPDAIDSNQWEKWFYMKQIMKSKNEYQDEFIRIGWHGGASHMRDFDVVSEAIADILKKYPNVKMQFAGWLPDEQFVHFKGITDKIEFVEWDKPAMFGKNLIQLDIGIAPLGIGTEFNDAKSPIKWMEYSMLGIPCVASNSVVYKCIEDGVTGYLVENIREKWVEKISMLIEDAELRKKIGRAAKERVLKKHSLKANLKNWEKILGV